VSQRTEQLRLGHGIKHMPPAINHPARIAEQIATLDLVSHGRVEFGTGESSSVAELDGFIVDPGKKREMWTEAVKVVVECLADEPFPGIEGEFVTMPPRNVMPKPVQKPHPPLWVACTQKSTIDLAARTGIGALSFSPSMPEDFKETVDHYYELLSTECVPIGRAVNPNILTLGGDLMTAPTEEGAWRRVGIRAGFFAYGILHYYVNGTHKPGVTDLWSAYERDVAVGKAGHTMGAIGSVDMARDWMLRFEETGVDELMFLVPPVEPEYVLESIELLGTKVLPEFIERDAAAQAAKAARLEPFIEQAMARREPDRHMDPDYEFGAVPVKWDTLEPITEVLNTMAERAAEAEAGNVDPRHRPREKH
jgi:alkanesulfonate monooxygenase SsuD/methylene tetrahydromethanopterin reductase-like flavin-dependent oxidoreductase (luciferase family)